MLADDIQLMSEADVCAALSLSRSTVRALVRRGELAQPLRLGARLSRWRATDVAAYVERFLTAAYQPADVEAARALATKAVVARAKKRAAKAVPAPAEPKRVGSRKVRS